MELILVLLAVSFSWRLQQANSLKSLKNPDPEYKLRMAEQYFVKKKYTKAQQII